jgi:rieske iron-sulfur protein
MRPWCPPSDPADARCCPCVGSLARRTVLKVMLGLGLGFGWSGPAGAQSDPRRARLQAGDRFVLAAGGRKGEIVGVADVALGEPPIAVYPMDPTTKIVRDDSRLNQVLLVHLDPAELSVETRARAVEGIVAYSAVCTHTGCDSWEWQAPTRTIKCPCHFSTFDVKDGARVLDGPAPRRLPSLPLEVVDGVLVATGGFSSRPGFQQGSG